MHISYKSPMWGEGQEIGNRWGYGNDMKCSQQKQKQQSTILPEKGALLNLIAIYFCKYLILSMISIHVSVILLQLVQFFILSHVFSVHITRVWKSITVWCSHFCQSYHQCGIFQFRLVWTLSLAVPSQKVIWESAAEKALNSWAEKQHRWGKKSL